MMKTIICKKCSASFVSETKKQREKEICRQCLETQEEPALIIKSNSFGSSGKKR